MSKRSKIILIVIAIGFIAALIWFGKKTKKVLLPMKQKRHLKLPLLKKQ